jgi:PhzF family phenazine biosynthesis protein
MVDMVREDCETTATVQDVPRAGQGAWSRALSARAFPQGRDPTRYATARVFQVDAFAGGPFEGNPAAVCLLTAPQDDAWMQGVAAEMNLSETAFVLPARDGFTLRWFTPATEVPLCGHATLAAAHVLWEAARVPERAKITFETCSGRLVARRVGGQIELELPARPVERVELPGDVLDALGAQPRWTGRTIDRGLGDTDYLVELESEEAVRRLQPDVRRLRDAQAGVIVTSQGSGPYDVVSRYFAPWWGIDEDPVTGSAHCALIPFWVERLGKPCLVAFQASARGGVLRGRVEGDRVSLSGGAVTVFQGLLLV